MSLVIPITAEQIINEQGYIGVINALTGQAAYLPAPELAELITTLAGGGGGEAPAASEVQVDSGPYTGQNVAAALSDLYGDGTTASQITSGNASIAYDNSTSGLTATNLKAAIDELKALIDAI